MITPSQKGFSLIELLIVVAIILIISAIAVPNLIHGKIAANQASAVSSLRTLQTAATTYQNTYQDGYPGGLGVMAPPGAGNPTCNAAGLIDAVLAMGAKSGYLFAWTTGAAANQIANPPLGCAVGGYTDMFSVTGTPFGYPTGTTFYCIDATGVIRQNNAAIVATATGCPAAAAPIGED